MTNRAASREIQRLVISSSRPSPCRSNCKRNSALPGNVSQTLSRSSVDARSLSNNKRSSANPRMRRCMTLLNMKLTLKIQSHGFSNVLCCRTPPKSNTNDVSPYWRWVSAQSKALQVTLLVPTWDQTERENPTKVAATYQNIFDNV